MPPSIQSSTSSSRAGLLLTMLALAACDAAPQPAPEVADAPAPDESPGVVVPPDLEPTPDAAADPCGSNPTYPVALRHQFPAEVGNLCPRPNRQRSFDFFGWQELVALNWPADASGQPMVDKKIGEEPQAKRVWQGFMGPSAVFLPDGAEPTWQPGAGIDVTQSSKAVAAEGGTSFLDATHFPVVDSRNNFVVFTLGINEVMFEYIVDNGLYSRAGQRVSNCAGADERLVQFPAGAVEVKAAWRIFPEKPSPVDARQMARYHHYATSVRVPAANSETGEELLLPVNLALIGFHIAQKTKAEHQWTWATFEHVDNLEPGGGFPSTFTTTHSTQPPNLPPIPRGVRFDPGRPPLKPFDEPYIWAKDMTRGYAALNTRAPTVIKRDTPIQSITDSPNLNRAWQTALAGVAGSPWGNYQLISVQWPTQPSARKCGDKNNDAGKPEPEILANIPIEVYNQSVRHGVPASSCINCHRNAFTTNGDYADFSYLLQFAK